MFVNVLGCILVQQVVPGAPPCLGIVDNSNRRSVRLGLRHIEIDITKENHIRVTDDGRGIRSIFKQVNLP